MSTLDLQLAQLWTALRDIRDRIDNEALPLAAHLELEDPKLIEALEALSERIGGHFAHWRLVSEPRVSA